MMQQIPLNAYAVESWAVTLGSDARVLVTGSNGWFGRTAVELCRRARINCLAITRDPSEIVTDEYISAAVWDETGIKAFDPTDVIDCAFQTREKLSSLDLQEFVGQNEMLINRIKWLASLESVKRVLTVSSGAAVYPDDAFLNPIEENPYGYLKRKAELVMAECAEEYNVASVIARAWSVSGGFCEKKSVFAFTDLLEQTFNGKVAINATKSVWRRYVAVEDLLALSMASSQASQCITIDSGGELVELEDLAIRMASNLNPQASINTGRTKTEPDDAYFSDVRIWDNAVMKTGFVALSLDEQIQNVARALSLAGR